MQKQSTSPSLANRIDLLFALDTTGSMYALLVALRSALSTKIRRLFETIPGLRVGFIVFGDDAAFGEVYSIKMLDLTDDVNKILNFIATCGNTHGGGPHANYELVLKEARSASWLSDRSKSLVIIGDEVPHKVGQHLPSRGGSNTVDWQNELKLLHSGLGVNVFGVHCLPGVRPGSETFYRALASRTDGHYLTLDQLSAIPDLVRACCYKAADGATGGSQLNGLETELKGQQSGRLTRNQDGWFSGLSGRAQSSAYTAVDLEAVPAGQFQPLNVYTREDVKEFCVTNGLEFAPGRIYQRLDENRPSCDVSDKKRVVLKDKVTGDLYSGNAARKRIGLPETGEHSLKYRDVQNGPYEVFVESTSYNRKLEVGQEVLFDLLHVAPAKKSAKKPAKPKA